MKKFIRIACSLTALIVIALALAGDYFYREAVKRGTEVELHREEEATPVFADERNNEIIEDAEEWYEEQTFEPLTMRSHDNLLLKADFLQNEQTTGKAVILVHGFRNEGKDMGDYAKFYHQQGFDILIPDSRGHGKSEGDYIGYGWHDRLDYQKWIQLLIDEKNSSSIFLHGNSMGAATVLMASGEDLPPEVKGIIADSGYTSAEDILAYQLKHLYNLPAFPIIQITSGMTKLRSGFTFGEASAKNQVANNTRPLFIIHGEADELVYPAMAEELYEAAGGDKILWMVPNAGHVKSYTVATAEYQERLKAFIKKVHCTL